MGCDFFEKTMDFRGKTVKTQIWDIGGQSLSSKNLPNYVLGSSVLFLCYDVTDPQSFGDLVDSPSPSSLSIQSRSSAQTKVLFMLLAPSF